MKTMNVNLEKLCQNLGYQFKDLSLLEQALRHCSVGFPNNERFEFLGDAAVNFIAGELVFHYFYNAREGHLSRLRASLVRGETLAELARRFQINEFLLLGHGEFCSGGAERESILSDAMEAIIGAIYLDSDFDTCRKVVCKWFHPRLKHLDDPISLKDAKTRLQEYLQGNRFPLPNYRLVKTKGEAHSQMFHIECSVNGLKQKAVGKGLSRRKAEQDAAKLFLEMLNYE